MNKPKQIISSGLGVQSSFLQKKGEKGMFGFKPYLSVFGDTKVEPQSVYQWMEELRSATSTPIHVVSAGNLAEASLRTGISKKTGNAWIKGLIPAFVKNFDGSKGILGRQCTEDFKILPIRRFLRDEVISKSEWKEWKTRHKNALKKLSDWNISVKEAKHNKQVPPLRPKEAWEECQDDPLIVLWIGISIDEADRAKESRVPWIRHWNPLLDHGISRSHCQKGVPGAPRSACRFCPFHSDAEWIRQRDEEPDEFEQSVSYEKKLQAAAKGILKGVPYLHDSLKPLDEVVFDTRPSHMQLDLFRNECSGMCGV
jgi:hypothetical protein